ncbi:MAG TPA: hypothetical protein VM864_08285 [Pyrinomonadaceae bacterium]|jgi:hypothetical protein|nr:hypothetical protein [Pyrinomonadaceae bacterium]
MTLRNFFKAALCASLLALAAASSTAPALAQVERNNWTWVHTDDGKKIEVKVEGQVEFNEDYSDVSAVPADGALRIVDTRDPSAARRLVVTRDASGGVLRDYTFNGARRDYDAAAREWLRQTLLVAARQGGLDARNRVRRILARGGTRALVDEIAHIQGDYARRIYFDEFLKVDNLRDEDRRSALANASRTITSDYERAQLLLHTADVFLVKDSLVPTYFESLGRIGSDYEHRRVLSAAIKRAGLSRDALLAMAQSAAGISSDYEKATFLIEAAGRYQSDELLRAAFASAMRSIGSDYERGRVQTRLARLTN